MALPRLSLMVVPAKKRMPGWPVTIGWFFSVGCRWESRTTSTAPGPIPTSMAEALWSRAMAFWFRPTLARNRV